jgi:hypothetical protein
MPEVRASRDWHRRKPERANSDPSPELAFVATRVAHLRSPWVLISVGAVASTGIAILPELRSLGLNLVGRSLYDVEDFSHEIPPGFGSSTPIPKSLPLQFVVSTTSFISLADDTRRKALFHPPQKQTPVHSQVRVGREGGSLQVFALLSLSLPGSVTSSDRTLSL